MKRGILLGALFLMGCNDTTPKIDIIIKLPKKLSEVSGIQIQKSSDAIFVIEDSGNGNYLYEVGLNDKKQRKIAIEAENTDWEDLASDKDGNLYLGDFGNNGNKRQDLCIYKINASLLQEETIKPDYKVSFYYPEQTAFPPSKKELLYDCEAFFELKGFFYLFTKNRSKDFDGTTLIYKIPNKEGNHPAQLLGRYKTGEDFNNSAITGAAISPDGSRFALLSHSRIWLFSEFNGDDFLKGKIERLELDHYSQKEAVSFKDENTLLIADEKDKSTGGNIYQFDLRNLKAKP
ncbi:hypothetical protein [Flavobacterium wongokense]|uniref:hypothetical protein n=1 Tax=Flavobacterium wongokense TaxID=2910674 RepID=UPI001F21E4F1|nr:hypothetical protein [Flavobacterium sp. WG47]MCF6133373.1 hypothetical protein [Flavobacterium sp. WG47]